MKNCIVCGEPIPMGLRCKPHAIERNRQRALERKLRLRQETIERQAKANEPPSDGVPWPATLLPIMIP